MSKRFILNETSYHGSGAINEIVTEVRARGFKKVRLLLMLTLFVLEGYKKAF